MSLLDSLKALGCQDDSSLIVYLKARQFTSLEAFRLAGSSTVTCVLFRPPPRFLFLWSPKHAKVPMPKVPQFTFYRIYKMDIPSRQRSTMRQMRLP